jgi:hypothetical protein
MKGHIVTLGSIVALAALGFQARLVHSQDASASSGVQVHMVITNEAVKDGDETPTLKPANVQLKQGKTALTVTQIVPAQGDNAALQLFILIDDTCDSSIGNNLTELKDFVNAQPATTAVAVGYMSNANVQIAQDFTTDHSLSVKAIRLPRGTLSASDSPYLSLVSLVKRWPQQKIRREILMISDGIDRLRGTRETGIPPVGERSRSNPMNPMAPPSSLGMATISVDADPASMNSQRYGIIVHGIYAPGVGRIGRNSWEAQLGQSGIAKIADETGGEFFALGNQQAVSFKPYLDRLQNIFNNQYYLVFQAIPRKNAGLQRVNISTELANTEIAAANNVWVPAAGESAASDKGN